MRSPSIATCSGKNAALISGTKAGVSAGSPNLMQSFGRVLAARLANALIENRFSGEERRGPHLFLNAQQLVVLGDAIGTRSRAGLDLPRSGGDGRSEEHTSELQ